MKRMQTYYDSNVKRIRQRIKTVSKLRNVAITVQDGFAFDVLATAKPSDLSDNALLFFCFPSELAFSTSFTRRSVSSASNGPHRQ